MAKTNWKSIDEYIAAQPVHTQMVLEKVRSTIRKALPTAEEAISYQIPAFKVGGRVAIFFAGWKNHYSIYPVGEEIAAAFGKEIQQYELSKGTIRFPLAEPVPVRLISGIAKILGQAAVERSETAAIRKSNAKKTVRKSR